MTLSGGDGWVWGGGGGGGGGSRQHSSLQVALLQGGTRELAELSRASAQAA